MTTEFQKTMPRAVPTSLCYTSIHTLQQGPDDPLRCQAALHLSDIAPDFEVAARLGLDLVQRHALGDLD